MDDTLQRALGSVALLQREVRDLRTQLQEAQTYAARLTDQLNDERVMVRTLRERTDMLESLRERVRHLEACIAEYERREGHTTKATLVLTGLRTA